MNALTNSDGNRLDQSDDVQSDLEILDNSVVPFDHSEMDVASNHANNNGGGGGGGRFLGLDMMRGLIMIIMAWDHTKDILVSPAWSPKVKGLEGWQGLFQSYDNDFWFFIARAVSNVCAPGFFLTMGMGMTMFTMSRIERGSSWLDIYKHFFIRGFILIVIGRLIDVPFFASTIVRVYKGDNITGFLRNYTRDNTDDLWVDAWFHSWEVMTGLGLTMWTSVFFLQSIFLLTQHDNKTSELSRPLLGATETVNWRRNPEFWGGLYCFLMFLISNLVIVAAQGDDFFKTMEKPQFPDFMAHATSFWEVLVRLFLIPGLLPAPLGTNSYPVIPWIGITLLGQGLGFSLRKDAKKTVTKIAKMGAFFLVMFVIVRLVGGPVGNYRGYPRHDGKRDGEEHVSWLMAFMVTSKYPPSPAYAFLYVGLDNLIIYGFFQAVERRQQRPVEELKSMRLKLGNFAWETIKIYGEVPLFFYVCHFWLLGTFAAFLAAVASTKYKISLPLCVVVWLCLLCILRVICFYYGRFKHTTPKNSIWRYL